MTRHHTGNREAEAGSDLLPFGEKQTQRVPHIRNGNYIFHTMEHQFDMELELQPLKGCTTYNSLASGIVAKLMDITDEQLRSSLADFRGCHTG